MGRGRRVGALIGPTGPWCRPRTRSRQAARPLERLFGGDRVVHGIGDTAEAGVDGHVGLGQDPVALGGQHVIDPTPVALHRAALDEALRHQAVDDGGDGRWADGQALGQVGGGGRALVEQPEDPVLGERQVDRAEADLDLLGQPRGGAPERAAVAWTAVATGVSSGFT